MPESNPVVQPTAGTTLPQYGAAVDHFIGARLPAWLRAAKPPLITAWAQALRRHHALQQQVATRLSSMLAPDAFCSPLLAKALKDELGVAADPAKLRFREIKVALERPAFDPANFDTLAAYATEAPLLQRAMQNFTEAQAQGSFFSGTSIIDEQHALDVEPGRFAQCCRTLDLGARYQAHLTQALAPGDGPLGSEPLKLMTDDRRCALEVDGLRSYMKGEIDAPAYLLLQQLLKGAASLSYQRYEVEVSGLQVLGQPVPGAFVLAAFMPSLEGAVRQGAIGAMQQVLVYLPGDPVRPLRQYPNWSGVSAALVAALKSDTYRDYFQGLFGIKARPGLIAMLQQQLARSSADLAVRRADLAGSLFSTLGQQQLDRILDDAGALVVPTAAVDAAIRQQWRNALDALGMTVLGLGASFVPGIGQVMLANTVVQTLGEVYESAQDWSHGQRLQALNHLLGVAGSLAAGAVLGAGASALVGSAQRSAFVDALLPIIRSAGNYRLWHLDLSAYQFARQLPVVTFTRSDGLVELDGEFWLEHEQHVYKVRERDGRWRLCHRERAQAYGPALETNGEGAWRLPGEDPAQWADKRLMLRRMGPLAQGLSEARQDQVLSIVNYDEAQWRQLHIENRPMPVHLRNTLEHFQNDARIDAFFKDLEGQTSSAGLDADLYQYCLDHLQPPDPDDEPTSLLDRIWEQMPRLRYELFEHLDAQDQVVMDDNVKLLRRDFPGLPQRHAQALVDQASHQAFESLSTRQRIPLSLAEQARRAQAQARVIKAIEGLCLRSTCNDDTVSLAFGLLRHMPAWPADLNLELRERSASGRLIDRLMPISETRQTRVLVRTQGEFEVFDEQGYELDEPLAFPTGLFEAIGGSVTPAQRQALGWTRADSVEQMRQHLVAEAMARREQLPNLLGQVTGRHAFNPGERLPDGRVGYPLSGRRLPGSRPFTDVVTTLFPGFNQNQVEVFIAQLANSGSSALAVLVRYQEEFNSLDATLELWRRGASGVVRRTRRAVADQLRRCWRRQTPRALDDTGQLRGYRLDIIGARIRQLPVLPERISFSHVTQLTLQGMRLTEIPDAFLARFNRLRLINLGDNHLTSIPAALAHLNHLRYLLLGRNRISLLHNGGDTLATLNSLEVLGLEHNPLEVLPDLTRLTRLRELHLRNTGIQTLDIRLLRCPFLEFVDLRDNRLTQLPEGYLQMFQPERFMLQGNPLSQNLWEQVNARVPVPQAQWDGEQMLLPPVSAEQNRRRWLLQADAGTRSGRESAWDRLLQAPGATEFVRLLGELTQTAEFLLTGADLDRRVWSMIEAMLEHTELRTQLFDLAAGPRGCQDTVANNFSALEVHFLLFQARAQAAVSSQPQQVLLTFARRLFRLDQVEQFARADMSARQQGGRGVDEVEVSLAYRLHLARELELPGQPRRMFYETTARIDERQYRAAAEAVRAAEASEALARFVSTRDFWVEHLRAQHTTTFMRTEQRFEARLDTLMELWGVIPDNDMNQRLLNLGQERTEALNALAFNLTQYALR